MKQLVTCQMTGAVSHQVEVYADSYTSMCIAACKQLIDTHRHSCLWYRLTLAI